MSIQFSCRNKPKPAMILGITGAIIIAGFVYAQHLLNDSFAPVTTEINRCTSPDGKLDAILYEKDGNATVSTIYFIAVVPKGRSSESPTVYLCDQVTEDKPFTLTWRERSLWIDGPSARIWKREQRAQVAGQAIEILVGKAP